MERIPLFYNYNLASTSYIYAKYGPYQPARKFITTNGSSTTVTGLAAADDALDEVDVGDIISVKNTSDAYVERVLTAKASADSCTVDSAVTISSDGTTGKPYQFRKWFSGTTTSDGWLAIDHLESPTVSFWITTLNATSITVTIEGRMRGGTPMTILEEAFTAATVSGGVSAQEPYVIRERVEEIRVGVKINTDSGNQSLSAWLSGNRRAA